MPYDDSDIEFDEDCPPLESGFYVNPVHRFRGRTLPTRNSPLDPIDPEYLEYIKSLSPLIQMEPELLGGMPVFKDTLVPVKRMFDYLLTGRTMNDFLRDYPAVSSDTATAVLENQATLFYEDISKALERIAQHN